MSRAATGGVEVNSTARWPERLEQVATLLRAEGAAILALQNAEVRTLFACRIEDDLAWRTVLGDKAVERAVAEQRAFATAIPAERWGDGAAYALLAPITSPGTERGVLCALRHGVPFDAVEVIAGEAAARLLSMAFSDAQAVAQAERDTAAAVPPAERTALRIAVVEAHPATHIGLEAILERAGLTLTLSCATLGEALAGLPGARFDAVLMGNVGDASPADAVQRLRLRARAEVIVIADERRGTDAHAALRAGAVGQVGRDAAPSRIVAALHAAASGLAAIDPAALEALLRSSPATPQTRTPAPDAVGPAARGDTATGREPETVADRRAPESSGDRASEPLSPREMELLRYLAEGYTNKEIARVMVLAEDTVKKGVQSLIAKLGAADRTHAVVLALRSGLIE